MKLHRAWTMLGVALSAPVLALVQATALLFRTTRTGELLKTVSLPRMRAQRGRTSLTVIGVALGVAVLLAVSLVNRSILESFAESVDDIAGKSDLEVRAGASGFDEGLLERVSSMPEIARATLAIEQTTRVEDARFGHERIFLVGVDLLSGHDDAFRSYDSDDVAAIKADPVAFLNSPYHLVLSRALAERYGYALHDTIFLRTPSGVRAFQIWGLLGSRGVGGAFGGAVALMDYAALQVAFERGRNIDQVDVVVEPGSDVARVQATLRKRLGDGFSVARPARRSDKVAKLLGSLRSGLTMASFVAVLVGMFLIANTMSISIMQRRREIGTLRALGMTRRQVLGLLTFEGVVLGIAGSALGVLLGIGLAYALLQTFVTAVSQTFTQASATTIHVDPWLAAASFALGVVATTLATALPARTGARTSPVEALSRGRHGYLRDGPPHRARADLLGIALLALSSLLLRLPSPEGVPLGATLACVALVLAGALLTPRIVQLVHRSARPLLARTLGVASELASENLRRETGRAATTASALMVGVAMSLAFAALVESFVASTLTWVDQMLPADLWVTSAARMVGGNSIPMTDALRAPLAALPGVDIVERLRMDDIEYRGTPVKLVAMDATALGGRAHLMVLEGDEGDAKRKLEAGAIVLSENFARRFGLHRGDAIALAGKHGMRTFEVAAVIVNYTSDLGSLLVDRATYVAHWGDERVDAYKLYLRPGVDPSPLRLTIEQRFGEAHDLFVLTNAEFRRQMLDVLEQTFGVMRVLELVAMLIAIFGVVNAVFAGVLDRVGELGMLRALGMLRRQVRTMVVVEAALLGLVGAIGGVVVGLAIGYVLLEHINVVQTGWYLPFRPSLSAVLETSVPVIVAAALGGWYPARFAAHLSTSHAPAHE